MQVEIWPSFPGTLIDIPDVWVEEPFLLLHRPAQSLQRCMVQLFTISRLPLMG